MSDEPPIEVKGQCYLIIATLQLPSCHTNDLTYTHAHRLFTQLKEKGSGMSIQLWSNTFKRKLAEHTHANYK